MKWDYWIKLYTETHCVARGLRASSIAAYEAALEQFKSYAQDQLDDRPPDRILPRDVLAYLLERGGKRGALFRTEARRRRIGSQHVAAVVRDAARRAGLDGRVTARTLRHSFATHLMDRGVDAGQISKLMGHAGPAESGVYLHILPGRKRSAVDKLDLD